MTSSTPESPERDAFLAALAKLFENDRDHTVRSFLGITEAWIDRIRAEAQTQANVELIRTIGFLRSCIRSGELLSAADDARIDDLLAAYAPAVNGGAKK